MLFHRAKDPQEVNNLYYRPEHQSAVRQLRARIEIWQRKTNDKLAFKES
jgi:hypothetical protein